MTNLTPVQHFEKSLSLHAKTINKSLPDHIKPARFLRAIVTAAQTNPEILNADQQSVFLSCQKAAKDGLLLDGEEAALVVYKTKKGNQWIQQASYQPMIKGVLKKVRNSGELKSIGAYNVHQNDEFSYNPATDSFPDHKANWFGERGPFVGVYAVAVLKDGSVHVEIMNHQEIEKIRRCSKSGTNKETGEPQGIWAQWYDRKAQVACIKRLCKRLPSSADVEQMLANDNEDYTSYEEVQTEKDITPDQTDPTPSGQTKAAQAVRAAVVEAEPVEAFINPETGEEIADPI